MMREKHRLGMLHVRVSGKDNAEVLLGEIHESLAKSQIGPHEVRTALAGKQARVRHDLVVARSASMQACSRFPDVGDERLLD